MGATMTLVRRIARPLLSAMFISGGIDALRNARPRWRRPPRRWHPRSPRRVPGPPGTTRRSWSRSTGRSRSAPGCCRTRPVPAALRGAACRQPRADDPAGHRFWEEEDATRRAQQRIHFLKNLSMLGGLMLAAVDTEGQPGLAWRARHASQHAAAGTRRTGRAARRETTRGRPRSTPGAARLTVRGGCDGWPATTLHAMIAP